MKHKVTIVILFKVSLFKDRLYSVTRFSMAAVIILHTLILTSDKNIHIKKYLVQQCMVFKKGTPNDIPVHGQVSQRRFKLAH